MTEVKHFQETLIFMDLVVDQNRAMQQLANTRPFSDGASHTGKAGQQVNVVKQSISKARSRLSVVPGDVADDLGEVVQCPLREEEAVIHLGKSSRTFSIGVDRPALASRMPSSMAARVASSSSSMPGAGFSKSNSLALDMLPC
jgi:hypothetical protein